MAHITIYGSYCKIWLILQDMAHIETYGTISSYMVPYGLTYLHIVSGLFTLNAPYETAHTGPAIFWFHMGNSILDAMWEM